MKRVYYIDSENVGCKWMQLLTDSKAHFIIFYTEFSGREHMTVAQLIQLFNLKNLSKQIRFVGCCKGDNALDFQLVSYLGYRLRKNRKQEVIIVSNDKGFDAVVSFWHAREVAIRRLPCMDIVQEAEQASDRLASKKSQPKKNKKNYIVDKDVLNKIINCVGKENLGDIYQVLVQFFGQTKGRKVYEIVKKGNFPVINLLWEREVRFKKLVELILIYVNTSKLDVPEAICNFLFDNIDGDRKMMLNRFTMVYPDKKPQELFKLFGPFLNMLFRLKY